MRWPAALASSCLLCQGIFAQEILWQRSGVSNQTFLAGHSVFLSDLDGDGWVDFVQGTQALNGQYYEAHVLVLSGRDGSALRSWVVPGNLSAAQLASAGDMDADGIRDYVVGSWALEVRSGRDDHVIWQIPNQPGSGYGWPVAGDLDVDADRKPDLVVDNGQYWREGQIYVFNNSGALLYRIATGAMGIWTWGDMFGRVGDVNGDRCDDFVLAGSDPLTGGGVAHVFSGKDGRLLVTGAAPQAERFGSGVSLGVGDVDGDGVPDFASSNDGGYYTNPGVVRVFSGTTGGTIYRWSRWTGSLGLWMSAGDLDVDGVADLLVGSGEPVQNTGGRIHWYSLRDGSEVTQLYPSGNPRYSTGLGEIVTVGPPQPGSPFPVFVTSEGNFGIAWAFPGQGRLTMYRAAPVGVARIGTACAGALGSAPRIGLRTLGNLGNAGVRLHVTDAPPGAPAVFLLGVSSTSWAGVSLPLALGTSGFNGCSLHTSIELAVGLWTGTTGVNAGYAYVDLMLPLAKQVPFPPVGFPVFGQWLVLGSGTTAHGALSDALTWRHY